VNEQYEAMSLPEKIGQLFIVDVWSSKEKTHTDRIKKLIREHHIGGVMFSKGGPYRQAILTNEYQALSKTKLLITQDAEWGLNMRLDSTYAFPWNMTLGAIKDNGLIEKTGRQIGKHCRRLGVHMNFAPDIDINTNPLNPIIGNRSFGEDMENVAQKGVAFTKGMQSELVLGSAKHFPGHGDTAQDSHKTLPTITFDKKRIDSVELHPFRRLIDSGVASIMVAHLNIPSLETNSGLPSSLSKTIVTDLLKKELGFKGLVLTDALNMKGAADFKEPGDVDLAAFLAGNDMLLIPENVPKAVLKITEAYTNGIISEERLSHSVKKILMAKYKVGLPQYTPIRLDGLEQDLNTSSNDMLYAELMENAITVLKNKDAILPLKNLALKKIAYVKFGDDSHTAFLSHLKKYTEVTEIEATTLDALIKQLNHYNHVIIGLHKSNSSPWKDYKFTDKELTWLYEIARVNSVSLNIFAKPYALLDLKTTTNFENIIVAYQNSAIAQQKAAELLFGAIAAKGVLPVTANEAFKVNTTIPSASLGRLGYAFPSEVGMRLATLEKIDSIMAYTIKKKMLPGAQVLVARKGKIVYHKNYGYHSYDKKIKVEDQSIYDLASLTKILATLPLLMELEEQKIITLDSDLGSLIPAYKDSNKSTITLKQMLSHYARLKPWIPFYLATLDSTTKKPDTALYSRKRSANHNLQVTSELFLKDSYKDSMFTIIKDQELLKKWRYRYSDIGYYILKNYLEDYYNKGLDELVQDHFYQSLGANYTLYNPLTKYPLNQITPSEEDRYYRFQRVQGYVHDMGAAMQNGIGGHAGVFSTANDVAKIMQMYINGGSYGGKQYFKPETIARFNTRYYRHKNVRRGLGFDKQQLGTSGPTCACADDSSFGHSGFTGTFTWADPKEELVYVFLSNRTYPDQENRLLIREDIRSEIQRVIYNAIVN
jgi:beta-glucosidase-like glycosyl hydrolase/CubicO group peptidase (beta-lactamase class C family)